MKDKRFTLVSDTPCPITVLNDIPLVRLQFGERTPLTSVKKRVRVAKGALLAEHGSPNVGDMHASIDGVIKDLTASYVEIQYEGLPLDVAGTAAAAAKDTELARPVEPVSFDGLDEIELGKTLKRLGIAIRPFTRPCELFIINCLNPEPGMLYTQELLAVHMPVIEAGFSLVRRLNNAPEFVLALPEGGSASLEGAGVRHVSPQYPNSLARPLIKIVTGAERTKHVTLVRLHNIFQLGLVARSGLPLTEQVATVFGKNYLAPLGTPVQTFLDIQGFKLESGDSVILGGAMRGVAISGLRRGLRKVDDAIQFIPKGSRPELEDNPCINCGACVLVCPMRLRPNMLSRYAEFGQYESCRKEQLATCIECGMCGWICPACRPMQQYFRMAKLQLGMPTFQHRLRGQ
ncbi:MAG: NADH:quinone oxidoreductase subunit RnfC [Desulfovibrio sp.]|jgi:electron transport complex protein RnfC|nr:NADH:quinone oxidoreductase subunit RnfC [Desulfovibrio sp.]